VNASITGVSTNVLPDSINVDSNGALAVLINGAANFNASQIDIPTVRFAGAATWQSTLMRIARKPVLYRIRHSANWPIGLPVGKGSRHRHLYGRARCRQRRR